LKKLLKDKRLIYISSGLILFVVIAVSGMNLLSSEQKELKLLNDHRKEMLILKDEYLSLKKRVDSAESSEDLSSAQGIVQAADEVFQSIGLKDKVKTVKSTNRRDMKEGIEEEAEFLIEKVSMNEMVNIFYKIENAPMILIIKKAAIKKSFENPELLNISLTLSFLKMK
jgi:hypothetical protein